MNRRFLEPIAFLSDCPVKWDELIPVFRRTFPRTIEDALLNNCRVRVRYQETHYDIFPVLDFMSRPVSFCIYGPAHVNRFPHV